METSERWHRQYPLLSVAQGHGLRTGLTGGQPFGGRHPSAAKWWAWAAGAGVSVGEPGAGAPGQWEEGK